MNKKWLSCFLIHFPFSATICESLVPSVKTAKWKELAGTISGTFSLPENCRGGIEIASVLLNALQKELAGKSHG
jgi:hypothetical protein